MQVRSWFLVIVGVSLLPASVRAQTFESVGIRAAGMAGAFVAVADDATAVYWNPAGLAAAGFVSLVVEGTAGDVGSTGFDAAGNAVGGTLGLEDGSGTLVALGTPPLGLSYYRLRTSGFEGDLSTDRPSGRGRTLVTDNLAVNLLHSLAEGVHVGAALRVVRGSAGEGAVAGPGSDPDAILDAAGDLTRHSSWAFDVDAGLLVARGRWRAGLAARNLVEPSFETPVAEVRLSPSRQVRAGTAFLPRPGTTLALDADLTRTVTSVGDVRRLAVGVEHLLGARVSVRGGVHASTAGAARPAGAFGASVAVTSTAWIDFHVTRGGHDAEHRWGVGGRVGF